MGAHRKQRGARYLQAPTRLADAGSARRPHRGHARQLRAIETMVADLHPTDEADPAKAELIAGNGNSNRCAAAWNSSNAPLTTDACRAAVRSAGVSSPATRALLCP